MTSYSNDHDVIASNSSYKNFHSFFDLHLFPPFW